MLECEGLREEAEPIPMNPLVLHREAAYAMNVGGEGGLGEGEGRESAIRVCWARHRWFNKVALRLRCF